VRFWESKDEVSRHWRIDRRFEPAMSRDDAERLRLRWREAVARAKGWVPAGGV
jgi:glycerol kinase